MQTWAKIERSKGRNSSMPIQYGAILTLEETERLNDLEIDSVNSGAPEEVTRYFQKKRSETGLYLTKPEEEIMETILGKKFICYKVSPTDIIMRSGLIKRVEFLSC